MNGAQRQTTMTMIEASGYCANQSTRGPPSEVISQSTTPNTGLSIMFFQAQRTHDRHHQERRDEECADDAAAPEPVVHQLGIEQADQQGDGNRRYGQDDRVQ